MEVYILDSLYRRQLVVDRFESLIWTERFAAQGDFELHIHSTLENRNRFLPGVRLACNESYRVMTVETIEDATDDEGRRILKVKGPSLENVLEQRMVAWNNAGVWEPWFTNDEPKDIATALFHDICVTGILNAGDIIAGVTEGNVIFPADTILPPEDPINYEAFKKSLYTAIKELCDAYLMGFRLVRHPLTNLLYFDIYMGVDRTTLQTTVPAVVFSPDLENLRNTNKLTSTALYKNAAYVVSPVGHEIVYPLDVDPLVAGFERRVLIVQADDIDDPNPVTASELMIRRGREELAKQVRFTALDGELAPNTQYKYGTHYNLGDLVELRDDDGLTSQMKVTEQIFVSDREGDRSYPTLATNTFVYPGSWLSMGPTVVWDDFDLEHWDEMP